MKNIHTVTGAFGNLGGYIADGLLKAGKKVETLTNSPLRASPLQGRIGVHPLTFDDPAALAKSLKNTAVLYNTYWVRYNADNFNYASGVENSGKIFAAAKKAGVRRVVQVSITNPDIHSPYEYFSGKARIEDALVQSGLANSILRPALLFGPEDILINNIAWMLRKFPVFGLFGFGEYRLQPIFIEDMARLAIAEGSKRGRRIVQAIGPETYTFKEMVKGLATAMGLKRLVLPMPASVGWTLGQAMGLALHDGLITWGEIKALMVDKLYVDAPAAGKTNLMQWARQNGDSIGYRYRSELQRRRDKGLGYGFVSKAKSVPR
jgi:uncharacterized protein YbjT (DUF2867 family)